MRTVYPQKETCNHRFPYPDIVANKFKLHTSSEMIAMTTIPTLADENGPSDNVRRERFTDDQLRLPLVTLARA